MKSLEGLTSGFLANQLGYASSEVQLASTWIDGKPIFRQVISVTGGNGTSTVTVAALGNVLDNIVSAQWSVVNVGVPTTVRANGGRVDIIQSSGAITITHAGLDFTGNTVFLILDYTKQ